MPQKQTLTPGQRQVYEFIRLYISKHRKAPTLSEIANGVGLNSIRSVTQYLQALERKVLIRRNRYSQRGITLVEAEEQKDELVSLPVFASAGCGSPSLIAERTFDEYITVSAKLTQNNHNPLFVVKASGGSMDEAGIFDGSYVLVEMTEYVDSNDLVVAIIEDNAVIKKISFANNAVILSPVSSDPSHHPFILDRDFKVFGRVVKIIKVEKNEDYEIIPIEEKHG